MKKIKDYLLTIIFVLLIGISFNVKAENFEYYITNSNNYEPINNNDVKNIKRGDTITVTAMLFNSDSVTGYKISSGKLTIRWDNEYLSLLEVNGKYYNDSISDIEGLTIASVNKEAKKLTINEIKSTGTLKSKLNKLVEFKFKVLETANFGETKIYQMDGEANLKCLTAEETTVSCGESSLSELKYNIMASNDNKLSSIKIDGTALEYFNENTNDYDVTVESSNEKIMIEATKKDNRASITGDTGEKKLDYGINKFTITVTSESGEKNVYHINVTREDKRSNINTLKTLTLSEGEINFKPSVLEYVVNVDNKIDKIIIKSSLTDSKSKYAVDYRNKEVELVEGSNKIEIKVISEKEEEKTYTIVINRALSSNNSLKSLKVNDEKITLDENMFTYEVTVENDVDEARIVAVPNDSRATVKLEDSYPLEEGENEINIKVLAPSGQEALYILNVNRKKTLSKDSLLTSLKIKGYDINFKPTETLYNLKIKDSESELEITATGEDSNATITIDGNKDLENGSIIKINVKAEDGTYTRYFINIEKGSKGISPIIIVIFVLLLLLGGCIGLIIYRKKKKEQNEFDKLDNLAEEEKGDPNAFEKVLEEKEESIVPEESVNDVKPVDENYVGAHENYVGTHIKEDSEIVPENKKDVE